MVAAREGGEACVCDLTEPLGLTQPTISHHLKILVEAGIFTATSAAGWSRRTAGRSSWTRSASWAPKDRPWSGIAGHPQGGAELVRCLLVLGLGGTVVHDAGPGLDRYRQEPALVGLDGGIRVTADGVTIDGFKITGMIADSGSS